MSSITTGERIADRYRIDSMLATGGMGAVYRAFDTRLSRPVAIKVLLAELAADDTQIKRFEREALASARLSHPGIVQVHDFGKTDRGLSYLVMELIEGHTLATELDRGRLETRRAVDIADQTLGALAAAHGAGIVHRDLKPANLMLVPLGGGREHVKVLDFGIAQLKTGDAYMRLTATGDVIGTPSYMAPEQARSEPCDARTDVYAMGMVLWSSLTGQRPYGTQHVAQMIVAVQTEVPTRADLVCADVPKSIATAIEKAIAKRAEDRFQTAADFAAALQKAKHAITPETRAPVPQTIPNPLAGRVLSPAPVPAYGAPPMPTPVPTRVEAIAAPLYGAPPMPTPMPIAAAPTPPPARKPRWWLRILLAITALLVVVGIVGAVVVVAAGAAFVGWFESLPSAQRPAIAAAPAIADASYCTAAARCCRLAGADASECDALASSDTSACWTAIGTYGDQIVAAGGDASPCSPTYAGP